MSVLAVAIKRRVADFALDVSFEAGDGVTGIIGPSGAGKSTVLQTIAGLATPDEGRVALDGEAFTDTARGVFLRPERRRIGYVFQDACLFPHMSVAQNLDYGARRRDAARTVSRSDVVELLGLAPLLDRRPHRLSGGEAQRVSIGRALLSAPRLILMDEPLSSLDLRRRREILPFIEALHRSLKLPIVYVSHNIDEIVQLADLVVVLHDGKVAASGDVATVLNRPEIQRLVLGEDTRDDPAAIVEARITRHDDTHNLSELGFGGAALTLTRLKLPIGASVRLRIHARDVAIATERPQGLSIQNIVEAVVAELRPAGSAQVDVRLSVAGTQGLTARITGRAVEQLGLAPGRKVWALVKSVALAGDARPPAF
ncbi:MAG: molybdenum ABC transporter ATP-binding protein [Parvibaculum sp.]|uniref:molybdenum ABC transporter ATP-binding protein n=1 Tax=Parvibaculum sp. TaxID=2024848 RepID=UPI0025F46E2F|nr:molybdenum ABC transporter ATP-binding protein [Parvibaculum sp.]MCE9649376.1 molybdenum ABC transporter ATP-binding protein [Parvibaculum sp.]